MSANSTVAALVVKPPEEMGLSGVIYKFIALDGCLYGA